MRVYVGILVDLHRAFEGVSEKSQVVIESVRNIFVQPPDKQPVIKFGFKLVLPSENAQVVIESFVISSFSLLINN